MSMQEIINIAAMSVEEYREQTEEWLKAHTVGMECLAGDDWLAAGLEAFKIIGCADTVLRKGAELDIIDLTHDLQEVLINLYEAWLVPSRKAEIWMASLSEPAQSRKDALEYKKSIATAQKIVTERSYRLARIKSVNNEMLAKLVKRYPPAELFDDDYK